MALKARNIIDNPGDIIAILIPLAIFYLATYVFLSVAGRLFFKREDGIAMVFGVVMRDLSIALAIAMTAFGKQGLTIALLIALAYVIQIQSAAWYVRFVDFIFGATVAKAVPAPVRLVQQEAIGRRKPEEMPKADGESLVPDFKRILYATDLSETARHAVRYACSLGHRYDAEVTVLHVIPDILDELSKGAGINLADHIDKREWERFNRNGVEKAQQAIHQRIHETSKSVTQQMPRCPLADENILVQTGNPADCIVSSARKGRYDLIIMGTHGHGKFEDRIIGSVAADVIRHSDVPVMVVRLPREHGVQGFKSDASAEISGQGRTAASL